MTVEAEFGEALDKPFGLGKCLGVLASFNREEERLDACAGQRSLERGGVEGCDGLVGDDGGVAGGDEGRDPSAGGGEESRADLDFVSVAGKLDLDGRGDFLGWRDDGGSPW